MVEPVSQCEYKNLPRENKQEKKETANLTRKISLPQDYCSNKT